MKEGDSLYKLSNIIEIDDFYYSGSTPCKRGRGAANKSKVIIAVENRGTEPGYAAMQVIERIDSNHLEEFAFRNIEEDQTVKTDDYPPYNVLDVYIERSRDVDFHHLGEVVKGQKPMKNSCFAALHRNEGFIS